MADVIEGRVEWFNRRKGYGFIEGDDGKKYFVHLTQLQQGTFIRENDKVSFTPKEGERGPVAEGVTLLKKGSEIEGEGGDAEPETTEEPEEETKEAE